ncbi:NADH-quinone oxidoreductase subunit E [Drosophila montana]|uniref:NADH-quinone oxidoreductase subunit E n=1 Tax=Drosophila montana TaxID=40370 RepID=UPI00313D244F
MMYANLLRLYQLPRLVLHAQPSRVICATPPRYKIDACNVYDKLKFEFSEENKCRAKELLGAYPEKELRGALLPLLDLAQRQHGWLPITAIQAVAEMLKIEPFAVWEVANFYTMFNLRPIGKYRVKVCMTTPCQLRGCADVMRVCEKTLELKDGETSKDMEFTLNATYCMGACVNGPVISVNDDLYEDLNVDETEKILCELKDGNIPPPGPRSGRFASEPITGPTSLLMPAPHAGFGMQELCKPKTKPC